MGMFKDESLSEIARRRRKWEGETLSAALKRLRLSESQVKFYSPLDIKDFDFSEKVGFPGEYPFTTSTYPEPIPGIRQRKGGGFLPSGGGLIRPGRLAGFGTAGDMRDFYTNMQRRGWRAGPNLELDLPTQCGYDSDNPQWEGEVGHVGTAIDTLRDFEILYEPFVGDMELDKIASHWVINAPCNIFLAMYIALAEQRGIPLDKLRATVQNDILKEYIARGNYIFPPRPSMRMIRDTITYCTKYLPYVNWTAVSGYHIREAGATRAQTLAFTFSNAIAYIQTGIDAGLNVDDFVHRMTFGGFSGGMEILKEVAFRRAARRIWAKIMKERFGAKTQLFRSFAGGMSGSYTTTVQRPLNNLTRTVLGGVAACLAGEIPTVTPPYDEPLGLGWSLEAQQLSEDASRILQFEAKLTEVTDPLAGSYYIEWLTDTIEEEAWDIIRLIDDMGGAVSAIEKGYMQEELAKAAYKYQQEIESGDRVTVGVNKFIGEEGEELEVSTTRAVEHPYDPEKIATAEKRQKANLAKLKRERNNQAVETSLKRLKNEAKDESANLIPPILEAVKAYASIGEICDVLREVFGEYEGWSIK